MSEKPKVKKKLFKPKKLLEGKTLALLRQELLLTNKQKVMAKKTWGSCRKLYNICKTQRDYVYEMYRRNIGPTKIIFPTFASQCKELVELKEEFSWLKEIPSQVLQQAIRWCDTSYSRFLKGISGLPKYKKRYQNACFTFPQGVKNARKVSKRIGKVFLPGFKEVSFRWTNKNIGKIHQTKIISILNKWYVCFTHEVDKKVLQTVGNIGAGDRGITNSLVVSDGSRFSLRVEDIVKLEDEISYCQRKIKRKKNKKELTKFTGKTDILKNKFKYKKNAEIKIEKAQAKRFRKSIKKNFKEIRKNNREAAFKKFKRRSKREEKLRFKIKKLYKRIFYIRDDFCHKTSNEIANNHSLFFMEDLHIDNMTASASGTVEKPGKNVAAKSGLNKSILRQGWGKLASYTSYKMRQRGNFLLKVPAPHTSTTCFKCKYSHKNNRHITDFKCISCGWECNADYNASLNIKYDGVVKLASIFLFSKRMSKAVGLIASVCGDTKVLNWVTEAETSKLWPVATKLS